MSQTTVAHSQAWCASVMHHKSKSFYFSTRILPTEKREAVEALYGICRFADDAADEPGYVRADRLAVLQSVEDDVTQVRNLGYDSAAPWFAALRRAAVRFEIDIADLVRLVRGCRSDVDGEPVRTMQQLESYSSAVAGTVGRCAMPILGAADEESLRRAERLGIAMQFTNVLRDVGEDKRMGRNYMPVDDFPGAPQSDVMRAVAAHARLYYREAKILAARVPNDGSRAALIMTGAIYEGILDKLESKRFDPHCGRVHIGTFGKITRAVRSVAFAYAGLPTIR
ncbi:MAG: phytoene/squalene synthase family protein [Vulcanimicrobiaceae bacterium]